jgi:hypothetical protein
VFRANRRASSLAAAFVQPRHRLPPACSSRCEAVHSPLKINKRGGNESRMPIDRPTAPSANRSKIGPSPCRVGGQGLDVPAHAIPRVPVVDLGRLWRKCHTLGVPSGVETSRFPRGGSHGANRRSMVKKILLATSALVILSMGSASAADLRRPLISRRRRHPCTAGRVSIGA